MIEPAAASGAPCRRTAGTGSVHPLEEKAMARQKKIMQLSKAHALEHRSRGRLGLALPEVALRAVQGGRDGINSIAPTPDPPFPGPIVRG
jgi:hypothetical protein